MDFNETWEDRVHKFSLNIPNEFWEEMRKNSRHYRYTCDFIMDAIFEKIEREKREPNNNVVPRKYHGFANGLKKNSFVASWFQKNS